MPKSCRTYNFFQTGNVALGFGSKIVSSHPVISYTEIFNTKSAVNGNNVNNKPQALIIDDETDICFLLKGILKHKNIEAAHAGTLAEGEQFLRQYEPSVIFLDNHLPDGFGIDHIRHFKNEYPLSRIIMITAHDTWYDREKAYSEGVDLFIGKPFTRDTIIKAVEKII